MLNAYGYYVFESNIILNKKIFHLNVVKKNIFKN